MRRTQHRPKREAQRSRELADLKRSQHQLEVEHARLLETLQKALRPRKERASKTAKPDTSPNQPCPVCAGPTKVVDLLRFKMRACPTCKWHAKET